MFAEDGAELELQLLPGLTDVTFHSTQQAGNCTQILRQYTWTREIDLREDGVPVPSEFELIADSIGQVAVVRGRLIGVRRIATYGIAYTLPGGEERSATLRCDPQDKTFQLIVDISLVAGGVIEFTEFRAGDWEVRARHVLKPGEQVWTVDP